MPTSLQGIAKKAQRQKRYRFRNLYGMLNEELLTESWCEIKKHAAYGVDEISAQDIDHIAISSSMTVSRTVVAGSCQSLCPGSPVFASR